ncbi:MAG: hypothetical protein ACRDUX_00445 [Mycobacterium sp.]
MIPSPPDQHPARGTARHLAVAVLLGAALAAAAVGAVAPTPNTSCGNGLIEAGEKCDSCPADCVASTCAAGEKRRFVVAYTPAPGFATASTVTLRIGFRSTLLSLPGTGSDPAVRARVRATGPDATVAVNGLGAAVRVLLSRKAGLPPGRVIELELDRCAGAKAPEAGDLSCVVETCAFGGSPLEGCKCTVESR